MKLQTEEITKLAKSVYRELVREDMIEILTSEAEILQKIEGILIADAKKEVAIENEAKKMMQKFEKQVQSGEIDYQKMYGMVKKQLMKEKKFIL